MTWWRGGTPQRPLWLPGADWTACPVTEVPTAPDFRRPQAPRGMEALLAQRHGRKLDPSVTPWYLDFPRAASSPTELLWIAHSPQMSADLAAENSAHAAERLSPAQKAAMTPEERRLHKGTTVRRHMTLTRVKVAVALAFLHRRPGYVPTDQDWMLAGVVMRISLGMLAYLWVEGTNYRKDIARQKGVDKAEEWDAQSEAMDAKEAARIEKLCLDIWRRMLQHGPLTVTLMRDGLSNGRQKIIRKAMDHGIDNDLVFFEDGTNLYFPRVNGNIVDARQPDGTYRYPTVRAV